MERYPRVTDVSPRPGRRLLITFDNGMRKVYDCTPLLDEEPFSALRQDWFFRTVRADQGGYGVSWDDETDLSESELWEHGETVEPADAHAH